MISWIWPHWNILLPFLILPIFFIRRLLSKSWRVPPIIIWWSAAYVILLMISWIWSFWALVWPIWSWILKTTGRRLRLKRSWDRMWILIPVVHGRIHIRWIGRPLRQMVWHHCQLLWVWHHPWVVGQRWHLHVHWHLKLLLIIKWIENRALLQKRLLFWFVILLTFFLEIKNSLWNISVYVLLMLNQSCVRRSTIVCFSLSWCSSSCSWLQILHLLHLLHLKHLLHWIELWIA